MTGNYCVNCGKELPNRRMQSHCLTEECNAAWAAYYCESHIERLDNGCMVWQAQMKKGVAWFSVVIGRDTPAGRRKDYRVLDFLTEQAGRTVYKFHAYKNLCGTERCVNIDHNEARIKQRTPKHLPTPQLMGHLKPEPIIARVDASERVAPSRLRKALQMARKQGFITVGMVDAICCDFLHIHPTELYGDEFFTA
jgi:hypothetical protein